MIAVWRTIIKNQRGQALVEMALVLPVLILLMFGIVEFGRIYSSQLMINSVAREGARAAAVGAPVNDGSIRTSMLTRMGGSAPPISLTIERTTFAPPPIEGNTVTCAIDYPVTIFAPVISAITGTTVHVKASVVLKIE